MPKDMKQLLIVAGGVILAGWLMWQFKDNNLISEARNGFDV